MSEHTLQNPIQESWSFVLSPKTANACCSFEAPRSRVAATLSKASALDCRAGPHPVSRRMTLRNRDLNTDKGEVGGSSPPRPTIQIASKYEAILTFPLSGNISQKPFCQKSARSPSRLQLPVRVRAAN